MSAIEVVDAIFGAGKTRFKTVLGGRLLSTAERERVKELRRANEILKLASAFFAQAELDRRLK